MELTLNKAVMDVQITGIRRFTYLVRETPGACALTIYNNLNGAYMVGQVGLEPT